MKKGKIKKLQLRKETITRLDGGHMERALGGGLPFETIGCTNGCIPVTTDCTPDCYVVTRQPDCYYVTPRCVWATHIAKDC